MAYDEIFKEKEIPIDCVRLREYNPTRGPGQTYTGSLLFAK
jgi:hypothetical protein